MFGRMPGPDGTTGRSSCSSTAVTDAIVDIRRGGFDVVLNNSLGPLPYTLLRGQPMMTVLHTPPTLEKVNAVITRPGWRPDPRHVFVSVSEFNSAAWRSVLPAVTCVPNGINLDHWHDLGVAQPDLAVWAARITPEKGLHLAIDAIREAGLRLEISGPVADQAYFDAEIAPRLRSGSATSATSITLGLGAPAEPRAACSCPRRPGPSRSVWRSSRRWPAARPVAAFATGAAAEIVTADAGSAGRGPDMPCTRPSDRRRAPDGSRRFQVRAQQFDARIMFDRYEKLMTAL